MEEQKISAVINTYNAAQHLRAVLECLKDFDEILICDMESTDDTLLIAAAYGCRVVTFPKGSHTIVEPARDFAIHQAACPWVLVVDADELITPELRQYLYALIARPDAPDGVLIPRKNQFMGTFMHGYYPDPNLRFFRRDVTTWPPVIHAQPQVEGRTVRIAGSQQQLAIVHLADENVRQRLDKINRYTEHEILKRAGRHYGVAAFIYRPLVRFVKCYILKGGFRDGVPGLIFALMEVVQQVAMMAKLYEYHRNK